MGTYRYLTLIALISFTHASCVPQNVSTNAQPTETGYPEVLAEKMDIETVGNMRYMEEENMNALTQEEHAMTAREKQRTLLLEQDFKGALDLMTLIEEELLQEKSHEEVSEYLIQIYCYLYLVLGKDGDALQKFEEFERSRDTTRKDTSVASEDLIDIPAVKESIFNNMKTTIMSRLNMANEIVAETKALLDNKDVGHVLFEKIPLFYAATLNTLITAQMVIGDFESALENIIWCRDYMNKHRDPVRGFSGPVSFGRQHYLSCHESLNSAEYFIKNLTETHFVRFVKGNIEPPRPVVGNPDKIDIRLPIVNHEFVSKIDGSIFTIEDFRRATAVPIIDPFPITQPENLPDINPWTE